MHRRTLLKMLLGSGCASLTMPNSAQAAAPSEALFSSLRKSPRMPVLFLGHGSPMNAIEDNPYHRSWQALGAEFGAHSGAKYPTPQLILCISAHWLTRGWHLTAMDAPKTIHDFGGFPQALFDQQYPAPGSPQLAERVIELASPTDVVADTHWGLDHGTWSVLKPMFPDAKVPVVQLSMDYSRPPAQHFAVGQQLARLRDHGVLIVGSGNIVHNLRAMKWGGTGPTPVYDWATEFDQKVANHVEHGQLPVLVDFQMLGQVSQLAHPTYEHYLPLLYAAGAASSTDKVRFFNADFQGASISMRSVVWS